MVLIIGGAYQGKLDFAKSAFGLSESDVFTCTGGEIDFSRRCVDRIEEFTLSWRQMNGLLCRYLSGEAARVSRLFCGLEERLK